MSIQKNQHRCEQETPQQGIYKTPKGIYPTRPSQAGANKFTTDKVQ